MPVAADDVDTLLRSPHVSVLDRSHRLTTVGVVLVVTVVALEAMAVAAVLPVTVRELHGLALYGWSFTAFFIADVIGMVDAGSRADRTGPRLPLVGGLALFAAGLLVAGAAPAMPVFVLGRALQGLGAGWIIVAVYVVVAGVYDEALRPRVFSALAAAWVVPALVGPAAAGAVAGALGWRWVFLGLAPVTAAAAVLLVPTLRGAGAGPGRAGGPGEGRRTTWAGARLAAGLALAQAAGQRPSWWSVPLLVAGGLLLVPALRALLPAGALRLRRGLPATVSYRGVLAGTFFTAEAFLPLTLAEQHGFGPAQAGLPLTAGAIGWSCASWVQGRRRADLSRGPLVRGGLLLVALGVGSLAVVAAPSTWPWLAVVSWTVGGAGMGLAIPTLSVFTLALSPAGAQGASSAALQIADVVGSIAGVAVAGSVLAFARAHAVASGPVVAGVDVVAALVALAAAGGTGRVGPQPAQASATSSA